MTVSNAARVVFLHHRTSTSTQEIRWGNPADAQKESTMKPESVVSRAGVDFENSKVQIIGSRRFIIMLWSNTTTTDRTQ
jgi:hypothetical protein